LYRVEPSGFGLVLKTHFDQIGLAPILFRMIELLSSMITASHCFLSGLSTASSYEHGSPSIVVEASTLCISPEPFPCALLLVTLCVSTGAFFDLLVVATTDRRNYLCVMTSSLDGA